MESLGEAQANYLRAKLAPFLARNPEAEVITGERDPSVVRAWGEEAIELTLSDDDEELFDGLNAVRLPPRFTAIWHEDNRDLEVIFTVIEGESPLLERTFEFRYRGKPYTCGFGPSSSRLITIARNSRLSGSTSSSHYRNLHQFWLFSHSLKEHPDLEYVRNGRPTSFWIRGIDEYDDDFVGNLVRNLNFHMSFLDRHSPTIIVHEEPIESPKLDEVRQLPVTSFPHAVSATDVDQHLLILWESAQQGDPFLRFIQYYQILEYEGFYHVQGKVRKTIERAIAAPDAISRTDWVAQQILDAMSEENRGDIAKINQMIEECVDAKEMWNILDGTLGVFSEPVELDGGFVLPEVVSASISYEEFVKSWNRQFANALHPVRNALVHARESRQSSSIAPTTANQ